MVWLLQVIQDSIREIKHSEDTIWRGIHNDIAKNLEKMKRLFGSMSAHARLSLVYADKIKY
jgi:hypothetical protein